MKRILSSILVLVTSVLFVHGQTVYPPQGTPLGTNRFLGTVVVDSGLVLPIGDTVIGNYYNPAVRKAGFTKWNNVTKKLNVFDGLSWYQVGGSSGGGGGGSVTQFTFTNSTGITGTVTNGTTTPNLSLALTKSAVGLSNVDNTSDASKPISTLTQGALNVRSPRISYKGLVTPAATQTDADSVALQFNWDGTIDAADTGNVPNTARGIVFNSRMWSYVDSMFRDGVVTNVSIATSSGDLILTSNNNYAKIGADIFYITVTSTGHVIHPTPPVYANDAAAASDGSLESGGEYTITGSTVLHIKP